MFFKNVLLCFYFRNVTIRANSIRVRAFPAMHYKSKAAAVVAVVAYYRKEHIIVLFWRRIKDVEDSPSPESNVVSTIF